MKRYLAILSMAVLGMGILGGVTFADSDEYELMIKGHRFIPQTLAVPEGKKFRLIVKNEDVSAEEFESFDLNREKVVAGKSKITIFLGPLSSKTYKFFGDFHQDTAQGILEVK